MRALATLVCLAVACGAPTVAPTRPALQPLTRAEVSAPRDASCLPLVSAECGCVYSCGIGWPDPAGGYVIRHRGWGENELQGRLDRWCVNTTCTEALFVQLLCTVDCEPRPADAHCHFEGDACVGSDW